MWVWRVIVLLIFNTGSDYRNEQVLRKQCSNQNGDEWGSLFVSFPLHLCVVPRKTKKKKGVRVG